MREESHLDDMRAAIRGDFERLERRRGSQRLLVAPSSPPEPPEELTPPGAPPDEPDERPPSWLDRLLGR